MSVSSPLSQCGVIVAERLLDGDSEPALTVLSQRTPGKTVNWFTKQHPDTWTGYQKCGTSTDHQGRNCAKNAYESMLVENGGAWNLVAAFCVSQIEADLQTTDIQFGYWLASIPKGEQAYDFIKEQMADNPRWLQAHGGGQGQQFHAEDLAIALAGKSNVRYPYREGSYMSVWGLYNNQHLGSNPPRDDYGLAAGERRPCQSTTTRRPTSSCATVLLQLAINWNTDPLTYIP
ncbi:hypothetical protein BCON_0632g00030 [Botryotinia convoluta]|uniref:Uncharacterized protein n=1 Tax=Botryotinia convoluta TaxID=54673 RepID=A0A4Z1H4Y0_9HELO|nr:hypothetical protein BCON_0632g00030 [Botryotinia convoluta]